MKILSTKELRLLSGNELAELLCNVIDAREAYPENSISKNALSLDEYYSDIDTAISRRQELLLQCREYITSDTIRIEEFSDIEICCEADVEDARDIIDAYLEDFSIKTCETFLSDVDNEDFLLVEGGWRTNGEYYFAKCDALDKRP